MVDVAKLAGVSQQTVSRVVNAHSNVSPEIRERVEEAMIRLRYRRNSAARALATNRSMILGVLSFAISVFGPALALFGIAEEARRRGYATSLVSLENIDAEIIRRALIALVEDGVDAIVVLVPMTAAVEVLQGLDLGVPIIRFEQGSLEPTPFSVSIDEQLGAQLATRHLIDLGHDTVHYIGGPEGWMASAARRRGWQIELAASGRYKPAELPASDWSAAAGYAAGQTLAEDGSVTAVLVSNDAMALGVIKALTKRGIQVPEDVSVVGFDDRDEVPYFRPALTTVRLDFTEVGWLAVESVLRALGGEPAQPIPIIQPELKVRDSSRPPRKRA